MPKGGARKGAGRPQGSQSALTRVRKELSQKVLQNGPSPLEVMLQTMRHLWREAKSGQKIISMGKAMQAVAIAEKVAPYVHPKLATVQHSGDRHRPLVVEIVRLGDGEAGKSGG